MRWLLAPCGGETGGGMAMGGGARMTACRSTASAASVGVGSWVQERSQLGDPQEQHERLTLREGAEAETPVERFRPFVQGLDDNRARRMNSAAVKARVAASTSNSDSSPRPW